MRRSRCNRNGRYWLARDPLNLLRGVYQGSDATSGGGGGDGTVKGGGGGAGMLIVNARKITGNFTFRARGGGGGSPASGNAGGGGGGGGGFVFVNTLDDSGFTGVFSAAACVPGGAGGTKQGTGVNGGSGSTGYAIKTVWT